METGPSRVRRIRFALLLALVLPAPAFGVSISITPGAQAVAPGSPVSVLVVVDGLGDGMPPSLGSFDLLLDYDPAILDVVGVDFFGFFGAPLSLTDVQTSPGSVRLAEQTLLAAPADLDVLQPQSFPLVQLRFDTLAPGTSSLDFSLALLVEAGGGLLVLAAANSGAIHVVPEAGAIALLGLALAALGVETRRRGGRPKGAPRSRR